MTLEQFEEWFAHYSPNAGCHKDSGDCKTCAKKKNKRTLYDLLSIWESRARLEKSSWTNGVSIDNIQMMAKVELKRLKDPIRKKIRSCSKEDQAFLMLKYSEYL